MRYLAFILALAATLAHGALNVETPRKTYTGNGATTDFAFAPTFTLSEASHLKVYLDDVLQASGYTQDADSVTFSVAPASGVEVKLERVTTLEQPTTTANLRLFSLNAISAALDRAARVAQEQALTTSDNFARSIRVPDGETLSELAAAASRKGLILYFDASTGAIDLKTPNQILALSDAIGDGIGIPTGGTTGQALVKTSDDPFEVDWDDVDLELTQEAWEAAVTDPTDAREAINADDVIDVRDYNLTAGLSQSAGVRTANTTALQAAVDAAGTTGKPLLLTAGPYEVDDEILLRYQGIKIIGDGYNWESNNTSRIVQTAAGKCAFKVAIPSGGAVNTHGITLEDVWLSGPGKATSTVAGFDAYLDGPGGSVYSDFTNLKRVRIDGFDQGLRLSKLANSTFENVMVYDCTDGVHIGGNCNSVTFLGCQFNTFPTGGHAFWIIGSGYVNVIGCEYGNGGNFLDFDTGVTGMTLEIYKLAVENQEETSRVASTNSVNLRGIRLIPGAYTTTVPFRFEASSFGSIENDAMSGFGNLSSPTRAVPFAQATLSSVPQRRHNQFSTVAPQLIEVHTDNSFANIEFSYGFNDGKAVRDDGGVTLSEGFRGMLLRKFRRDSLGSGYPDQVQVIVKEWGSWVAKDIVNDHALRSTSSAATSLNLVVNTRYRATHTATQTFTLPTSVHVDDEIEVACIGSGGVNVEQPAGHSIQYGATLTTTGTGHGLALAQGDVVRLKYYNAGKWQVIAGNFAATTY